MSARVCSLPIPIFASTDETGGRSSRYAPRRASDHHHPLKQTDRRNWPVNTVCIFFCIFLSLLVTLEVRAWAVQRPARLA